MKLDSLRSAIGVVPQDTVSLHTIYSQIFWTSRSKRLFIQNLLSRLSSHSNVSAHTKQWIFSFQFSSLFPVYIIVSFPNLLLFSRVACTALQVLFNDTIFHNIHYGRLSATEEEVPATLYLVRTSNLNLNKPYLTQISI